MTAETRTYQRLARDFAAHRAWAAVALHHADRSPGERFHLAECYYEATIGMMMRHEAAKFRRISTPSGN